MLVDSRMVDFVVGRLVVTVGTMMLVMVDACVDIVGLMITSSLMPA